MAITLNKMRLSSKKVRGQNDPCKDKSRFYAQKRGIARLHHGIAGLHRGKVSVIRGKVSVICGKVTMN